MEKIIFGVIICILFSPTLTFGQFECPIQNKIFVFVNPSSEVVSNECSPSYDKCNGKIVWKNGSNYHGNFIKGKIEGEGEFTFPNKFKYNGDFKKSVPHGKGKIIFEDDSQYDGEWINGKFHGKGVFIFPCGYEYIGDFKNGEMDGKGILRISESETFWGTWINNKVNGEGIHKRGDRSKLIITYFNGEKNGLGTIIYESGDTLRGNWTDGKIDGKSVLKFKDGSKITHHWKNGNLEEKVVFTQKSGLNLSGNPEMLAKMIFKTSLGEEGEIEKNFSLAWYSVGMEYKNQQNYKEANKNLQYAQMFLDPFEDSGFAERLDMELKYSKEAEEQAEVARKNDEK